MCAPAGSELWRGEPHPALRGCVLGYTGFAQRAAGAVGFVELPGIVVPVILDLAEGWRVGDARRPEAAGIRLGSFTAGLTDGPRVEHPGSARCLHST